MGISTIAVLPRRADLRGRRPRAPRSSPATSPARLARRRHRPRSASQPTRARVIRRRSRHTPPSSTRAASTSFRLRGERHAWSPTSIANLQRAVRDSAARLVQRLHPGARRRRRSSRSRCATLIEPRGRRASRCRSTRSSRRREIVRALHDRRDVARLDLARGARDARDRHEPDRRALEHRRGRRGPVALDPRRRRRPRRSAIKQVASARFGVTDPLPGRRRRAADQDRAGRQAGRGRPAARPQGRPRDRAPAPLDARGRPDLAAAASRHLLDRGSRAAHLRPEARQPGGRDQRQARRRGRRRHDRRRRRQGLCRAHRDRGHRRRHRREPRVLASSTPACPWELGLAETQQVLVAQRPARARAPAGRRRPAHGPRRGRRRAARRRGVRLLDRAARRRRLRS